MGDIRKEDFLKMQTEDVPEKCPNGRINYIFDDKLKYRFIENHMGDSHQAVSNS